MAPNDAFPMTCMQRSLNLVDPAVLELNRGSLSSSLTQEFILVHTSEQDSFQFIAVAENAV